MAQGYGVPEQIRETEARTADADACSGRTEGRVAGWAFRKPRGACAARRGRGLFVTTTAPASRPVVRARCLVPPKTKDPAISVFN
jgi:hypothetical protein